MRYSCDVFCTLQFEAIHHCPKEVCPKEVPYLMRPHRHIFHVECRAHAQHDNRDIEFIEYKHRVEEYCNRVFAKKDNGPTSCEQIAELILDEFPETYRVTVSEDGENGAIVTRVDEE